MPKSVPVKNDIDFSIRFYEGILERKGDFVQVLIALGELYTQKGWHQKGLAIDRRLAVLRPDDPIVFYNLACSYSLLNCVDKAFGAMRQAIHKGYDDFQYLARDKDLENLARDIRFQRYLTRLTARRVRRVKKNQNDASTR